MAEERVCYRVGYSYRVLERSLTRTESLYSTLLDCMTFGTDFVRF